MRDPMTFEERLAATFDRLVAGAPVDDEPRHLALAAIETSAGGRHGSRSSLRIVWLAAAVVALAGLLAMGLLAGRLRESPLPAIVASPAPSVSVPPAGPSASPFPVLPGEPWIAYMSQVAGPGSDRLWLVRPDGSDRHQLATGLDGQQEHPDWSPDGSRILFDHWFTDPTRTGLDLLDDWVMNADGSAARRVAWCDSPCYQLGYPSWAPDGGRFVVSRFDELVGDAWGASAVEIVDLATGTRRVAWASADGSQAVHNPRWSPDGTRIVFTLETYSDATESTLVSSVVAIVNANGSSADPLVITPAELGAGSPDWSPDGTRIAFHNRFDPGEAATRTTATDIWTVAPDGSGLTNVTNLGLGSQRAIEPTWTPDGSRLVFTLVDGFGGGQIPAVALMDADGSNVQRLGFASGTAGRLRPTR